MYKQRVYIYPRSLPKNNYNIYSPTILYLRAREFRTLHSAHWNDGATVELSAWAADDEAFVGRWHCGEEGMGARGLGGVYSALVL